MIPIVVFATLWLFLVGVSASYTKCADPLMLIIIGCFALLCTIIASIYITPVRRKDDNSWNYTDRRNKKK